MSTYLEYLCVSAVAPEVPGDLLAQVLLTDLGQPLRSNEGPMAQAQQVGGGREWGACVYAGSWFPGLSR